MNTIPFSSLTPYEKVIFLRNYRQTSQPMYKNKTVIFDRELVFVIYSCPICYSLSKFYVRPEDLLNLSTRSFCINCGNNNVLKYVDEEPISKAQLFKPKNILDYFELDD